MPTRRAPWWMFVIATSFLLYASLVPYQFFRGAASFPEGLDLRFTHGGLVVSGVLPKSQAEQVGFRPGDRVLAVDGQLIRNVHDLQAIDANLRAGQPQRWEIMRGERRLQVEVASAAKAPVGSGVYVAEYLAITVVYLLLGLFIAFRRPYDPLARLGAWFIATAGIFYGVPTGWAATWRHLPTALGALLWIPQLSRFVAEGILLTFLATFPRRLFRSPWPWVLVWTPVLATLPWRVTAMYSVIYRPGHTVAAPEWMFRVGAIRAVLYLAAGVSVLAINYRRLADPNERRRVRVLVAGTTLAVLSASTYVVLESLGMELTGWAAVAGALLLPICLVCPFSFAYAILRHRVLDIQVIIRRGVQYALARGVVRSLLPALGAILAVDLMVHRQQSLIAILWARGWVYAGLAVLAFAVHSWRKQWLEAVDRRFFRERYDARQVLGEVVEEVRAARSMEQVAPRVVARIETGLHPEFVALLVRKPNDATYCAVASAPGGHAPPPLPAESKIVALVRLLGKPVAVSHTESGWVTQQLPHEETNFLREAHIDLLVPVSTTTGGMEALLVLGVKRSEEPYTSEDTDLLKAIAASLAIVLERPAGAPDSVIEAFEECPRCGTCYDTGTRSCPEEGSNLVPIHASRTLAGRYRLERRRGRGGMGAVYEATDSALERRVAVKLIREELAGTAEAAERFRREARAAASFAHPNVVTIYDFGVDGGRRAFLVMELLEGSTVRGELQRERRLDRNRVVEILRGVCAAVDAAHRRQLIHRDLKPENIFLAKGEVAEVTKVLDFGIAKFVPAGTYGTSDLTQGTAETGAGLLLGTINYMSPEQLRGESVSVGWDLWALAVVAYEMLAGVVPFAGASPGETHARILAGRFTPLTNHLPNAPPMYQEFFARAFALDRSERPNSTRAFFTELERAAS